MKQCPRCNRTYTDDTLNFCLEDGTVLSSSRDPEATWVIHQNQPSSTIEGTRRSRALKFSGYEWTVKSSNERVGPGSNYFSDSNENVWIDELEQLHLRTTLRKGIWYCAEVVCREIFGYGEYIFFLASRIDVLDPNVVFGLFTWDDTAPEDNFREIDIEFARWGNRKSRNSQYVVQPSDNPENIKRFNTELTGDYTTHIIDWLPKRIFFQSIHGHYENPPEGHLIQEWSCEGRNIPKSGKENVRMNLWLNKGRQPENNNEVEVVIRDFRFRPAQESP